MLTWGETKWQLGVWDSGDEIGGKIVQRGRSEGLVTSGGGAEELGGHRGDS